ncbi:MAG: hypothetical protein AAF970_14230 [Bacteroidota bacterium]
MLSGCNFLGELSDTQALEVRIENQTTVPWNLFRILLTTTNPEGGFDIVHEHRIEQRVEDGDTTAYITITSNVSLPPWKAVDRIQVNASNPDYNRVGQPGGRDFIQELPPPLHPGRYTMRLEFGRREEGGLLFDPRLTLIRDS